MTWRAISVGPYHAGALASLGGDDDLGAEHAHNLAALHAEGLRHADDALVPLLLGPDRYCTPRHQTLSNARFLR